MAPGIFERIQSRIELWRLEQRYTRRRNRRSAFVSNAIYVDGEYIYQTPNNTGSSTNSSDSDDSRPSAPAHSQSFSPAATPAAAMTSKERKKLNRFSSMPGFGSMGNSVAPPPSADDWRTQRASYDETRR